MKKLRDIFLNEEESLRIENAVEEAERRTSAEIVVAVVPESSSYLHALLLGALLSSVFLATVVTAAVSMRYLWSSLPVSFLWIFPSVFVSGFFLFYLLFRTVGRMKRPFIPPSELDTEVYEAALDTFYRNGLNRTKRQNALLIFVSVFEKRVRVIADTGISERLDDSVFSSVVDNMIRGIREGRAADALCAAVDECGDILREVFPPEEGDVNELENFIDNPDGTP